ncbi:LysM peptidoglycan-binding domain-containing protein [uncultured Metabacillus sp.]|uniref:LysM peptidoglycan-binding domain-containing protein n=1 Tax=Metabacillus sp. Hm71 TaxID=3450743 RepID=UPI0026229BDA|nr:LysM peptidoglycan-binding domain-containing protein [uncultured Metabacillus sp.]
MSEFEKRSDQAGNLRSRMIDDYKERHGDFPPRSEVHKDKEKKKKPKMKYPIISILAIFFVMLPILFLSITTYYSSRHHQSADGESLSGNETVFVSTGAPEDEEQDTASLEATESIEETEEVEPVQTDETSNANKEETIIDDGNEQKTEDTVEVDAEAKESAETDSTNYREVITHKVAANETLFKIAIKYYNSRSGEDIIREYNKLQGDTVYEGQILKIPLK